MGSTTRQMRCGLLLLLCGTAVSALYHDSPKASTVVQDLPSTSEEPDESGLNLALLRFKARIQDSSLVAAEVEELEGENAELKGAKEKLEVKNGRLEQELVQRQVDQDESDLARRVAENKAAEDAVRAADDAAVAAKASGDAAAAAAAAEAKAMAEAAAHAHAAAAAAAATTIKQMKEEKALMQAQIDTLEQDKKAQDEKDEKAAAAKEEDDDDDDEGHQTNNPRAKPQEKRVDQGSAPATPPPTHRSAQRPTQRQTQRAKPQEKG